MMRKYLVVVFLFAAGCTARINDARSLVTDDDYNGDGDLFNATSCFPDGTDCQENCWNCCNGAFDNDGTTCGGQCLTSGTECNISDTSNTCNLCCNYTYWKNEDTYECGCIEDGSSCIPGESCYQCCNGAYDNNGYTCGGTCIADGTECVFGEDCHLCCTGSNYWYSTGKYTCGTEECFEDGETCVPNDSCGKCCSGVAFDGDGTVCGGECLASGTECGFLSTCGKCCDGISYWDSTAGSMKCGYRPCLEDDTTCIPGVTCYNCCNGAYGDNGSKCGGTCSPAGTECDYFGSCSSCCDTSKFNKDSGKFECSSYDDYYEDPNGQF